MIVDIEAGVVVRLDRRRNSSSLGGAYDISDLSKADQDRIVLQRGVTVVKPVPFRRAPKPARASKPKPEPVVEPTAPAATEAVEAEPEPEPEPDDGMAALKFASREAKKLFEEKDLDIDLLAASDVEASSEHGLTTADVRNVIAYRDNLEGN